MSTTTDTNVPVNHIDLDSAEAQKMFSDAFSASRGVEPPAIVPVIPEPVVDTPAVVEAKKEDISAVVTITPEAKVDTPSAQVTEPTAAPVQRPSDIPDWAAKLDPELQDKVREVLRSKLQAEQRARSDSGRISAFQKQILERDRRIADLATQSNKPQDPNLAAAGKQDQANTLEAWKQLNDAEPAIAAAVDARLAQIQEQMAGVKDAVKAQTDPLYQQQERAYVEDQRRLLTEAIPNYVEVVNHPVYKYWFDQKASSGIKKLAGTSTDHQDAVNVLSMYAQWAQTPQALDELVSRGIISKDDVPQQAPAQTVQTSTQVDTALADKVAKSRNDKVTAAPVVANTPSPIAPGNVNALHKSKPGDGVDLEGDEAVALFAKAYKENKR